MQDKKYIIIGKKVLELTQKEDGFWYDPWGVIWAIIDEKASLDQTVRCGIGLFSLPSSHPLTRGCKAHDYLYSSPAYQAFHTRLMADQLLLKHLEITSRGKWYSIFAKPFYWTSRLLGGMYWENKKTR